MWSYKSALRWRPPMLWMALTWIVWVALLATLLWAANKGLAMQDEGSLLLSYKHPSEAIASTSHFAFIVDWLFGWLHPDVVSFRVLKLFLSVASVGVFALGLSRWLRGIVRATRTHWVQFGLLLPFIGIGDLFGYSLFGQTLSYNSFNDNILLFCYGILLLALARPQNLSARQAGAYILVGGLAGIDFFVKFSTSVAFICVCAVMVLAVSKGVWWERVGKLALLAFGYVAGLLAFFLLILNFSTWSAGFRSSMRAVSGSSHRPHELLAGTIQNLLLVLGMSAFQVVVSGVLFYLLYRIAQRRQHGTRAVLTCRVMGLFAAAMLLALAVMEAVQKNVGGSGWGNILGFTTVIAFSIGLIALCRLVSGSSLTNSLASQWQALGIMLFLAAAPLVGVVGSNVPLISAADEYAAFLFAVIVCLLAVTPDVPWHRGIIPGFWLIPLVLVVTVTVQGTLLHPFGVPRSLLAQTVALAQTGDLADLRVDGNTQRFFQAVRRLITSYSDYHTGDTIISAYDMPGLVYVLGGVSPGAPWFYADGPQQGRNCAELRSTHLTHLDRSIILVQPVMLPPFRACLRGVGVNFPAGYRLVGRVRSPYDGRILSVFVPRRPDVSRAL